ncbi:MAG: hypothetical protein Q7R91_01170 [bacterium]|nr:hypothetical protein [bacterium]
MVEVLRRSIFASDTHKDANGNKCSCKIGLSHHKDSFGKDCTCFIFKNHHKDFKGMECTCRIVLDHDTKPSQHKDSDGRPCAGPFQSASLSDKRVCNWCRREEDYYPDEIVVVFKNGVSAGVVGKFITDFKLSSGALLFSAKDKTSGISMVAGFAVAVVKIAFSEGTMLDGIIGEVEKSELVRFASRVMKVSFQSFPAVGDQ